MSEYITETGAADSFNAALAGILDTEQRVEMADIYAKSGIWCTDQALDKSANELENYKLVMISLHISPETIAESTADLLETTLTRISTEIIRNARWRKFILIGSHPGAKNRTYLFGLVDALHWNDGHNFYLPQTGCQGTVYGLDQRVDNDIGLLENLYNHIHKIDPHSSVHWLSELRWRENEYMLGEQRAVCTFENYEHLCELSTWKGNVGKTAREALTAGGVNQAFDSNEAQKRATASILTQNGKNPQQLVAEVEVVIG